MKYTYKQNDVVNFNVDETTKGIGIIVGICDVTLKQINNVTNLTYMVRVVSVDDGCVKFPNEGYPYDTIPCREYSLSCRL